MIFKHVTGACVLFGLLGCSVKSGTVEKRPPVIKKGENGQDVNKPTESRLEYGTVIADSFSGLLWPSEWTEKELEENVNKINRLSKEITKNVGADMRAMAELNSLQVEFLQNKCIETSDQGVDEGMEAGDYPEDNDWSWDKDIEPVASGSPGHEEYLKVLSDRIKCRNNFQLRATKREEIKVNAPQRYKENDGYKAQITAIAGEKNNIGATARGAVFELKQSEIKITIENFNNTGFTYTTHPEANTNKNIVLIDRNTVKLEDQNDTLKFVLPGAGEDQGKEFSFELQRLKNLSQSSKSDGKLLRRYDGVIFKGTLNIKKNGETIRKGSGQIIGSMAALEAANR